MHWSSFLRETFPHPPRQRSTRVVIRATLLSLGRLVEHLSGVEHLRNVQGPFVVAVNHSQYTEAFLVPALIAWCRGGRIVRFMADWNFMLLPPVYVLFKSAQVIPVTQKRARPRFLTGLRDVLVSEPSGIDLARQCLSDGRPVGLFVEGTANRHPTQMLRGQTGAARLSLEARCPVLPVGIRFPHHTSRTEPIPHWASLSVHVGAPLPPPDADPSAPHAIQSWHARIMERVAALAHKHWHPRSPRTKLC